MIVPAPQDKPKAACGQAKDIMAGANRHDVQVFFNWTDRPGYVAYEDPLQVAAIPFRETWK